MRRYKELPDANPNDLYWTLKQFVYRRDSLVKSATTTKIQLHEQLVKNYTSYKKFFCNIDAYGKILKLILILNLLMEIHIRSLDMFIILQ